MFVASVAGLKGLPNESVYCASKFAQVGFAQAVDYETREKGGQGECGCAGWRAYPLCLWNGTNRW
ncbi:MAG: SDR family NAD(P)-dependent oxidoreductase [Chloroflexota bacterium]